MAKPVRAYDALYDTTYTVSSATDHYREQTRGGAYTIKQCPDFKNFTSDLRHHPATTYRLLSNDRVPAFVNREYRAAPAPPAELAHKSEPHNVSGGNRAKYFQQPHFTTEAPVVLVKAPREVPQPVAKLTPIDPDAYQRARTIGTQSDFRESEAQTDPYSPDYVVPVEPSTKQQVLSQHHHCNGPEVAQLGEIKFDAAARIGVAEVAKIDKLRAQRAFEATLPPLDNVDLLPLRQQMMEAWENKEWAEREQEILSLQEERLQLLQEAIEAREAKVEEDHADRVQATTDRLLINKQDAFTNIHKARVKAVRHLSDARKYVENNRYRAAKDVSIIESYANPGSQAYAPVQRNGTFPESKPKGKEINTEQFVPASLAGIEALESFLPESMLTMKIKAPQRSKKGYKQRHEDAMRAHLEATASVLADARKQGAAAGAPHSGLGYGEVWPLPVAGLPEAASSLKRQRVVVRNAERPETPVLAPPDDDAALHKAARLLQRLIRGRAIQNDMFGGAAFCADLVTELMTPLPAAPSAQVPGSADVAAATAATMVGSAVREMLQIMAMDDSRKKQLALDALQAKRRELESVCARAPVKDSRGTSNDAVGQEEAASRSESSSMTEHQGPSEAGATEPAAQQDMLDQTSTAHLPGVDERNEDLTNHVVKIQAGWRGHQTRKQLANARMQPVHNSPHEAPSSDMDSEEAALASNEADNQLIDEDMSHVVTIQAGIRGRLARKRVAELRAPAAECTAQDKPAMLEAGDSSQAPTAELHAHVCRIQAGARGYLTRKHLREQQAMATAGAGAGFVEAATGPQEFCRERVDSSAGSPVQDDDEAEQSAGTGSDNEEASDGEGRDAAQGCACGETGLIDFTEEQQDAIVRIQAGVRGHLARRRLRGQHTDGVDVVADEGNQRDA